MAQYQSFKQVRFCKVYLGILEQTAWLLCESSNAIVILSLPFYFEASQSLSESQLKSHVLQEAFLNTATC